MEVTETTLEVNKFARRSRHLRIFSRGDIVKIHFRDILRGAFKKLSFLHDNPATKWVQGLLNTIKSAIPSVLPVSPQRRLVFQAVIVSGMLLVSTSVAPFMFSSASTGYSNDYIGAYTLPGDILVSNEEGYLIKINPQTDIANRVGMTDYAVHTIESGESLSVIAQRYGVSSKTIMWENGMSNANSIRAGQSLLIPPVDGISHTVASGDSLEKLATKYEINVDSIIAQNGLETDILSKGQKVFLPGAEPIQPISTVAAGSTATTGARIDARSYADSSDAPIVGKVFIYPTKGKITQGYHAGHYALDIADRSKPAVWSAGGGTITKASTGTWGGGYGNHVIVDHGNGLQSLYAHLDSVAVYEGQYVGQGEVIGVMGNTGRVYGATGIHLHWEVIQNGVKQYPGNFY
ncbi:M23 family metallopeptidase [Candidatus Peregrinibacteria bacterium]|jgi:murein DD-endopeptidase MepM/ murein hydrolase activator NlpD|nr:M23 family metallopeptidase [Candidatus Peregrinibacteria bacterium]MBT7736792.1 M23 family metallopeptidase [Candidatus Peregrinibacteria bacterium]